MYLQIIMLIFILCLNVLYTFFYCCVFRAIYSCGEIIISCFMKFLAKSRLLLSNKFPLKKETIV